ncbi:MAG TPA: AzlC family ABC transporter permease [Sedimentibacter sp.]|nr:AzlC family ABC transporter permease [Sedimentibacter sp.]HOW22592.1 AzlC family ABC transporter permease [Sedimentibacter sp.]HRC80124.1 AzlC family ABC transporter permease [Sedimentibacter sp.]
MAGYVFLSIAYGVYMNAFGFNFLYPMFMSMLIYAGTVQFVAVGLLMAVFDPLNAFFLTLMINARYLFYGISMLNKYRINGLKGAFLVFGMSDETFSINLTADIPEDIDEGWFMFFVTILNYTYWVSGSILGGLFGELIEFNTKGLEFAMTAMFIVIFLEQWLKEKSHSSSLLGLGVSASCLIIFGSDNFIIPSMIVILLILTLKKEPFMKAGETK